MEQRIIRVKTLMSSTTAVIKTDVRTLGEFKQLKEVKDLGINWSSSKMLDFESKASYEVDDAVLPATNCILLNTPTKSKSGMDWSKANCADCKAEIKKLKNAGVNIPFNYTVKKTEVLQQFLTEYYNSAKSVKTPGSSVKSLIDEVIAKLNYAISDLNTLKTIPVEEESAVLRITEKELEDTLKKYSK